jgi:hypothetical protein
MSEILDLLNKDQIGTGEPTAMFIVSQPKVGKTEAFLQLPDSFLIDVENGSKTYTGKKFNVRQYAAEKGMSNLNALAWCISELTKLPQEKKPRFLGVDTTTALEDIANELALNNYKQTAMGKGYTGKDITNLAQGAGYGWLREAFKTIYDNLKLCVRDGGCVIFLGHAKSGSISKNGQDLSAKDVALTGKIKMLFTSDMDANGFLYRKGNSNENIISFITQEQDLFSGTRMPYLAGKEFLFSKKDKDTSKLTTCWDTIFPSLKGNTK